MRGQPYVHSNLGGGVNKELAPYSLSEGQARDALNVHTTPIGTIKKRNGFVPINSTSYSSSLTSLFALHSPTRYLVGARDTVLTSHNPTNGVEEIIKSGLTNGAKWSFIQAPTQDDQGPLFGMNGVDTPLFWRATSASVAAGTWTANTGSLPNGKYLTYHDNRVYVAGVSGNESTLYWSDIVKPRDWASPNGGSTQFDPEDGQTITGIGKVGPYLLVFKERKTFLVTDSNTGAYRRISSNIGCEANRSIVETDVGTFFLSEDQGIVITDGNSFNPISIPVRPILNSIPGASLVSSAAVFKDSSYYICVPVGGVNDTILQYDLRTESWWIHKVAYSSSVMGGVTDWAILEPSSTATLFSSSALAGKIFESFKADTYLDNADDLYNSYWISPWHTWGQPHIRKRVREIRADAYGTFTVATNRSFSTASVSEEEKVWEVSEESSTFGGTGTLGGGGIYGDPTVISERRYYTPGVGRAWSVKFESLNNQDMQIYSYTTAVDFRTD